MISFIIPTYKNDKSLIKCVEEIGKIVTSLNLEYEIIVVDNFLTNQYVAKLSVFHDLSLKIFKNPVLGAHNSRRLGLYNSKGDIIVFVDDDNYLTSDYVVFILSTLESKISSNFFIGCATKEFTNVDWKNNNYDPFTYACGSLEGQNFKNNIPVYWGAGMAMNRELAFNIFKKDLVVEGRMDKKKYIMSGEDHEYSLRAFFLKAQFKYYPKIGLYHDFDINRLNDDYYKKAQIGFSYAAYLLKNYYEIHSKSKFYANVFSGFLYNLLFAIGYNLKHSLQFTGWLILNDSLSFSKFKKRFIAVNDFI
jgi:glycosyltransferase involved in cell wall biosynthesis